jgi:CRISPR-associated protein Csy1
MIQLRRGLLGEAESAFRRAIARSPVHDPSWRGLAETLQTAGMDDAAVGAWRRWVELRSASPEARSEFGQALARMHRWKEAEDELSAGIDVPGANPINASRLAFVRRERGDTDGALAMFDRASRLAPDSLTPRMARALFLPQIYDDAAGLHRWRARYESGLDELESDIPALRQKPEALWRLDWSNFYLAYQGENDLVLQRRYAGVVSALAAAAAPHWTMATPRGNQNGKRLRIGFASSFFRHCTVGSYFGPWVTGLERDRFEVHAFYCGSEIDQTTLAIRSGAERFVQIANDIRQLGSAIRAADLDVLIYPQLGMDGRDATLAALRLAPIQCAAWGHPETSGSGEIDFFFSCADMEPADSQTQYSERLLFLPGLGTRYTRLGVPRMSRAHFGLPDTGRLYVCPHSLFKIHPDNDPMFADVLVRDPSGLLVLCADIAQPVSTCFRERLSRTLQQRGIDVAKRVVFQPLRPPPEFRALLAVCDVMLDTLHWSGGNTSLDALAAGLPIVACPGKLMRGRQSAAMLRTIGLPRLVTDDPAEAVTRAIEVANETGQGIREEIARDRDALFDRREPILALEEHLLRLCGRAQ